MTDPLDEPIPQPQETEQPIADPLQAESELSESVRMLKSMIKDAVQTGIRKELAATTLPQVMPSASPMSTQSPMTNFAQVAPGTPESAQVIDRNRMPSFDNAFQFGKYALTPVIDFQSLPQLTNYIIKELNLSNLTAEEIERVQSISGLIRDCCMMNDGATAESYFFDMLYILLPSRSLSAKNLELLSTNKQIQVIRANENEEQEDGKQKSKMFK